MSEIVMRSSYDELGRRYDAANRNLMREILRAEKAERALAEERAVYDEHVKATDCLQFRADLQAALAEAKGLREAMSNAQEEFCGNECFTERKRIRAVDFHWGFCERLRAALAPPGEK